MKALSVLHSVERVQSGAGPTVDDLRAAHGPMLAGLSDSDQHRFWKRLGVWLPRAATSLDALYGAEAAAQLLSRLVEVAARGAASRKAELRLLDASREIEPDWFQRPDVIGYVAYAKQFGPQLRDIGTRIDYLGELGVTYLHLMNVLRTRPSPNDGGFAVSDYRSVQQDLGAMDDLEALADRLRAQGISLCIDFVMNHTAEEHEWAQKARAGDEHFRDYYLVYPDRTVPDAFEKTLPEVFPEIAPGNFTWDPALNGWVWTTFNTYQWDLNYRNPDVVVEMLEVMLYLANVGIDVLRLDAVAFTWKRLGTNCQNQPEAHLIVQVLRALMAVAAPAVVLKAEAIVGPRELTTYLGSHERQRPECQIAYHNQLMVMVWSALASKDAVLLSEAMRRLPPTPSTAGWVTYVRCHDDIGWAVDDSDAEATGISGAAHRAFLAQWYRGDFPGSFSSGRSFSVNEETGDERTCGMTASLCGISHAELTGDSAAIDVGMRRLLLAYGVMAAFGIPLVYMGDEVAMGSDDSYLSDPTRADDSRWMHRPVMDWDRVERRRVAATIEQRVFAGLTRLLSIRSRTPPMRQGGVTTILRVDAAAVFAFARAHPEHGRLLGLANFSETAAVVRDDVLGAAGMGVDAVDVLGDAAVLDGQIMLGPLTVAWFTNDATDRVVPLPPRG